MKYILPILLLLCNVAYSQNLKDIQPTSSLYKIQTKELSGSIKFKIQFRKHTDLFTNKSKKFLLLSYKYNYQTEPSTVALYAKDVEDLITVLNYIENTSPVLKNFDHTSITYKSYNSELDIMFYAAKNHLMYDTKVWKARVNFNNSKNSIYVNQERLKELKDLLIKYQSLLN